MTAGRDPLRLLSVTEAARVLGVRKTRVVEEIRKGRLNAKRVGCRWKVAVRSLERWTDKGEAA